MSDLAVDIVVNNYNYARFLSAAIDSALAQSHPRTKVVVVDDGSTDESREVISSYGNAIVPVLSHHGGQAAAINAGFAAGGGDVVIFLDSDDVLLPHAAEAVAKAFAGDSRLVKVQYRMTVIDEQGHATGAVKPPRGSWMPSGDLRREELVFPFDLGWMATSGNAFRRSLLDKMLPIPEADFRLGADWYLRHVAALFGPVMSLEDPAAAYRVHRANNYEPAGPRLDLSHVRKSIGYAAATRAQLVAAARAMGLAVPGGEILSVADLGNRMISLRLDPGTHPLADDSAVGLALDGARAAFRRWDVRWPVKLVFVAWFLTMAAAPRSIARKAGELFLFPELRRPLTRTVARLRTPLARQV